MQLQLTRKDFPKHLKKNLLIYPTTDTFIRHLLKHVLTPPESVLWRRLLPVQKSCWRELSKSRYARMTASDIEGAGEELCRLFQTAYDDIASCIQTGLTHADETPKYVVLKEKVENPRTGRTWLRETYICLSPHGCLMYARTNALRTAFFAYTDARSHAPYDLYWAGLHKLLAQAQRTEASITWYNTEDGIRVTGLSVTRMTPDTLTQANNPWPRPREAFGKALPLEDDPFEAWVRGKYLVN